MKKYFRVWPRDEPTPEKPEPDDTETKYKAHYGRMRDMITRNEVRIPGDKRVLTARDFAAIVGPGVICEYNEQYKILRVVR